jgi:hypothetical protein
LSDRAIRQALEDQGILEPVPPSAEVKREDALRILRYEETRGMRMRDLYELREALDAPAR